MSLSAPSSLASTVASIERSADIDALCTAVRTFARPLGYDRFVLYTAPPAGEGVIDQLLWVEGDWFGVGADVDAATYLARCPMNRHVLETERPFFWTKSGAEGQESYRVVTRPTGGGVHGLQVPVFGQAGLVGAMSFGGADIDSSLDARLGLEAVAIAAVGTGRRLTAASDRSARTRTLSARELEVMRWIASGRQHSDIALRLGLSERTVENHLRRIRRRLGVSNTAQAVQVLVRSGQLEN
ncbi:MAG: LuxR C-terminal-related transcriptional regulator [Proteobacteria bacterium]|nr:LuxR C-terminal-related transcriptional regulator [Pseudomonadota bacterium]